MNIAAPSALLKQLPPRKASTTEADVARDGAQFEAALENQRAAVQGSSVLLSPQFNPPQAGAFGDLACAVYRFNLAGYDRDNTLRVSWGTPNAWPYAWLGMADMTGDRWEWKLCTNTGILNFSDPAKYTAAGGDALVAVVMAGVGDYKLDSVRFGAPQPVNHELWFYLQTNLQVQQNVDDAIALVNRAADAGYTACVVADSKLDRVSDIGSIYWPKLQALDTACKARGVRLIPALCSLGWADAILYHDPNLIEGQHFEDVQFSVSGGSADSVQDASFANGGMENHIGDNFDGWNEMDAASLSADTAEHHSGATSVRFSNFSGNARITQTITVKPWHHYVYSFWIKSASAVPAGSIRSIVFDKNFSKLLTFNSFSVQSTQDWTQYYIAFNSQDNDQVTPYIGIWGGVSGSFWLDDVSIVNAGLVNLIRRPGAPFSVKSADGSVTYAEGVDYDYASDPNMGVNPYPGVYDLYHARPLLSIPAGSAISDGDTLLVSGYHAVQTDEGKTACCLTEDAVYDIIEANFAKLEELIDPQQVLVAVDEHRVAGWCASCQAQGTTPGGLIAYATNRIDGIAQAQLPGCRVVTWSDMYDPDHNAVASYYLCNGSTTNTFAGNPPASWDVANWRFFDYNGHTPDTSIAFFSGRGNRQVLAGYYDRGDSSDIAPWLDYSQGYGGVYACMYTTWGGDYSQLENWAQAVKDWDEGNL